MNNILRPNKYGVYRCINNADNTRDYVLVRPKGRVPRLIEIGDALEQNKKPTSNGFIPWR